MPTRGIYNPLVPSSETKAGGEWLPNAITVFVRAIITAGAIVMFFYFLYGGFMWITSGGDAKKTEEAGKQITNAIIGAILLAGGWAIIAILDKFLGLRILEGIKIPAL